MRNYLPAYLISMLLGGCPDAWGPGEQTSFEDLEKEYNLIQQKESKLSRSQRDVIERMYENRKGEKV